MSYYIGLTKLSLDKCVLTMFLTNFHHGPFFLNE